MRSEPLNLASILAAAKSEDRPELLRKHINRFIADLLYSSVEDLPDNDKAFLEMGLDSITVVKLKDLINQAFSDKIALSSKDILDHPTVNQLAGYIEALIL